MLWYVAESATNVDIALQRDFYRAEAEEVAATRLSETVRHSFHASSALIAGSHCLVSIVLHENSSGHSIWTLAHDILLVKLQNLIHLSQKCTVLIHRSKSS